MLPLQEHSAILLTCIKRLLVLKTNLWSFWEWLFYTGFTVWSIIYKWKLVRPSSPWSLILVCLYFTRRAIAVTTALMLTICMLGNFSCFCFCLLVNFFKKFFQEHYQSVKWFELVLILVQIVCKSYQQMASVATRKKNLFYSSLKTESHTIWIPIRTNIL